MMQVWISMGSNLGDREGYLRFAVQKLRNTEGITVKQVSSLYQTAPWGKEDQGEFLNAAALLETSLLPLDLLHILQQIEQDAGRERKVHWGERTLDLDVIAMDDMISDDPVLTLPHPYYRERAFVLAPLAELDPDLAIAGDPSVSELLKACDPKLYVQCIPSEHWYEK